MINLIYNQITSVLVLHYFVPSKLKQHIIFPVVSDGEIPGFKVEGSWRFERSEIEK